MKVLDVLIQGCPNKLISLHTGGKFMGADVDKVKDKPMNSLSSAVTSGKKLVDRAKPHVEKAAGVSIEKAKDLADKTTDSVVRGVHKVMGSSDYFAKADEWDAFSKTCRDAVIQVVRVEEYRSTTDGIPTTSAR